MIKDAYDLPARGAPLTTEAFGYSDFGIVYVNRPSANQDELEQLIMDRMATDAVLIAVNWHNDPARSGWWMQHQEYGDPVCGVFVKP